MNWKEIDYLDNRFSVSDTGQIKNNKTGKILKAYIHKKGYCYISLRLDGKYGKTTSLKIHRVVAKAFIPNPENKPQINHIDGNKLNNYHTNLEWVTAQENSKDAYDNGLNFNHKNENNPAHKLTNAEVTFIRENYNTIGPRALGRMFNICHVHAINIFKGKKRPQEA